MSTAHSVLLYGAEVWSGALTKRVNRQRLARVQRRGALRVASAYRTVSESAVLVIAGVIPIALLAEERRRIFLRRNEPDGAVAARDERLRTLDEWQQSWEGVLHGRWTKQLIGDLRPWINRKHGETDFYLTQLLSGHGYFQSYLHKIGKSRSSDCLFCVGERDDACHIFFFCRRWDRQRRDLREKIGELSPDGLVGEMLKTSDNWNCVTHYARAILTVKKGILDGLQVPRVEGDLF